jgi:hypothetical protein
LLVVVCKWKGCKSLDRPEKGGKQSKDEKSVREENTNKTEQYTKKKKKKNLPSGRQPFQQPTASDISVSRRGGEKMQSLKRMRRKKHKYKMMINSKFMPNKKKITLQRQPQ